MFFKTEQFIILQKEMVLKFGIETAYILQKIIDTNNRINEKEFIEENKKIVPKVEQILRKLKKEEIIKKNKDSFDFIDENLSFYYKNEEEVLIAQPLRETKKKKEEKKEKFFNYFLELLPFKEEKTLNLLKEFIDYRMRKFPLTEAICQRQAKLLIDYSNNNEKIVQRIIENAINAGWRSFYPLNKRESEQILLEQEKNGFETEITEEIMQKMNRYM